MLGLIALGVAGGLAAEGFLIKWNRNKEILDGESKWMNEHYCKLPRNADCTVRDVDRTKIEEGK